MLQFPMIPHQSFAVLNSSYSTRLYWNPPLRVSSIVEALSSDYEEADYSKNHWIVLMHTVGMEFETEQALFNYYIRTLATVVGSDEEAKRKTYFVACGYPFGFGAELDDETSYGLYEHPGVTQVVEDFGHKYRKYNIGDQSAPHFTPINRNHRVDDIFSYHHLSECNSAWSSDHWLIHIQSPHGEFSTRQQVIDLCIRMLAEVVGSVDDAKKKIYTFWCKMPFGFGAAIDKETLIRLKALPDVVLALPDYAFDVKLKDAVRSLNCFSLMNHHHRLDNVFSYHHLSEKNSKWNSDHWLIVIKQHEFGFTTREETVDLFIKILAEVIGSEQEAKQKIYIIWSHFPFGFGAEIDNETSNKLKGFKHVLNVLPDYAFDVKDKVTRGLLICHLLQKSKFEAYSLRNLKNIEEVDQPWSRRNLLEHPECGDN